MSDTDTALDVALRVATAFDAAGIFYFLGGSLASSLQGDPRAINDIDFVVDMVRGRYAASQLHWVPILPSTKWLWPMLSGVAGP